MLQMIHRVIPFNSLINGLPKEGEEGIPKEIWLYKAHASSAFDIYNSPPGCKSCLSCHLREGRGPENEWWAVYHLGQYTVVIWINFLHHVRDPRTVLDSGFRTVNSTHFQIPGTRFQIAYQWNLDSRLQRLVGFQITWAVFRISKSKIRIPQAKKSRILDSTTKSFLGSGFPNMRQSFQMYPTVIFFLSFLSLSFEKKNSHKTSFISKFVFYLRLY